MTEWLVYAMISVFLLMSVLISFILFLLKYFGWLTPSKLNEHEILLNSLEICSISFLWYFISMSFTLYNKWLLQKCYGGFNYPITLTAIHMIMKFTVSRIWKFFINTDKLAKVSWENMFLVVIPVGLLTVTDIVFSNLALFFLPLSMYTTIKGCCLIFTFFWGVVFGIHEFRCNLFVTVVGITLGLGVAVVTSINLNLYGVIFALGSASASGLRWVLLQVLAEKDSQSKNVMVTLYRFSPFSAISIIPFALTIDMPELVDSHFATNVDEFYAVLGLSVLGGLISFVLIVVEVKLLRITSSLTMSVIGQIKEMLQISVAMVFLNETIQVKTGLGIALSIVASYYYRYFNNLNNSKTNSIRDYAAVHTDEGDTNDKDEENTLTVNIGSDLEMVSKTMWPSPPKSALD